MSSKFISIRGAREHNLKNVDVDLPRDKLIVLTGVSGSAELLSSPPERRPTFVAADLAGLFAAPDAVRVPVREATLGGWRIVRDGTTVTLTGDGTSVNALRLLAGPAWDGADTFRSGSDAACALLRDWRLEG